MMPAVAARAATALALLLTLAAAPLLAQDPAAEDGLFITVANPITSNVTNVVKEQTERARQRKDRKITRIVYDFNPDDREAATPDFGPCYELAKYIRSLHELTTIAYVHNKVTRHTVLPVLACRELAMAGTDSTKIGEVFPDANAARDPLEVQAYLLIGGETKAGVVQKMIDPAAVLMEGRRNNAAFYFDGRKRAEAEALGVTNIKPDPVLPAGRVALLGGDEAIRLGLARLNHKDSRQQVAEAYGLSASSLREDPLQGRAPVAYRIEIRGPVDGAMLETMTRRIRRALANRANLLILQIDCAGGSEVVAREFANFLRTLKGDDGSPVMTVAYIPNEAPNTAAFIAFGCTEIVMAQNARLGDFSNLFPVEAPPPQPGRGKRNAPPPKQAPPQPAKNAAAVSASLEELARDQGIPPILAAGMLDPDLEIHRVRTAKGTLERRLISGKELDEDRQQPEPQWVAEEQVKHKGKLLVLTGSRAKELGVARYTLDTADENQVYALYGLDPAKVNKARPDWIDAVAQFLRMDIVATLLVMVGIGCLILELKIPGATAPGVIAAVCFVLFFWSQSQMSGQVVILAILLFLLGLVLIGIEIFILPGFGFVGISGIVLMLAGLALATLERRAQTSAEWLDLGRTLTQFGLGMVVAAIGAIVFARYLPNIPVANRMVLTPPSENPETAAEPPALPGVEQAAALLGAVGTSATVLRPAGMAKFGEQYVDVVTEGGFVPAGARVQVIEVEGNRIVVKEV